MKPKAALIASLLALAPVFAQNAPQAAVPQTPALKEAHHRFDLVATRAVANFRSADSIEARLRADGATLNPQITSLRLRIEAALDEGQADLDKGDVDAAKKATDRAEGLVDRFARRLGGD
jgi:hypothetical protein